MKLYVRKVVDYEVVIDRSLTGLVSSVKQFIDVGWEPVGGVSTDCDESFYLQAIVKYEDDNNE